MLLKSGLRFFLVTDHNQSGKEMLQKISVPRFSNLDNLRFDKKIAESSLPQMRQDKPRKTIRAHMGTKPGIHYSNPFIVIILCLMNW